MTTEDRRRDQTLTSAAYERYERALRSYLRHRLRNQEDARELAQEVWARLLRVDDPAKVLSPRAYIYRVAANCVAEFQLMRKRDPVRFDSDVFGIAAEGAECAVPDNATESLGRENEIYRLLSALPRTYRQIVLMRICEGQSFANIASKLGLTAGTVERYCQSALTQVRRGARKSK